MMKKIMIAILVKEESSQLFQLLGFALSTFPY